MRRVFVLLATSALVAAVGCGGKSYEKRLDSTLDQMRYRMRLDANLHPAPTKGKLEQQLIYIRPPKNMEPAPAKEFQLTVLEPGKFDVAENFYSKDGQFLYVLARVRRPANPAAKKVATPENTAVRADFTSDVLATLAGAFNVEIDATKAKAENKRSNSFKHLTFESGGKNVQVYIAGSKASQYEVALIFAYPKADQASAVSKMELALGAFETGERARAAFSGRVGEEEGGEPGAGAAPPPI
jgi:hypothetical protein